MRKRKLIGSAFYKEKLLVMVEEIKKIVSTKVQQIEDTYLKQGKAFNLLEQLDEVHTRIILTTAFGGSNVSEVELPFEQNGSFLKKSLGEYLRDIFLYLAFRSARYEIVLVPYLLFFYYTKTDREMLRNIILVRNYCRKLIKERRVNPLK